MRSVNLLGRARVLARPAIQESGFRRAHFPRRAVIDDRRAYRGRASPDSWGPGGSTSPAPGRHRRYSLLRATTFLWARTTKSTIADRCTRNMDGPGTRSTPRATVLRNKDGPGIRSTPRATALRNKDGPGTRSTPRATVLRNKDGPGTRSTPRATVPRNKDGPGTRSTPRATVPRNTDGQEVLRPGPGRQPEPRTFVGASSRGSPGRGLGGGTPHKGPPKAAATARPRAGPRAGGWGAARPTRGRAKRGRGVGLSCQWGLGPGRLAGLE
jgi:hypothetical protein